MRSEAAGKLLILALVGLRFALPDEGFLVFLNLAWFFNALFYSDMELWGGAWAGRQGAIRST